MKLHPIAWALVLGAVPGCAWLNADRRYPGLGSGGALLFLRYKQARPAGAIPETVRGGRPRWCFEASPCDGVIVVVNAGPQSTCTCTDCVLLQYSDERGTRTLWRYQDVSGVHRLALSPHSDVLYFVVWVRRPWRRAKSWMLYAYDLQSRRPLGAMSLGQGPTPRCPLREPR